VVWQAAAIRDVNQHYEAFVNVPRAACFPPRTFGKMQQTHCSIYLDRKDCKIKHCMIGLQSNAPYIKPSTLPPKVGSSRTRWRLFLCASAANRSQKLQRAMTQIIGLLIDGVNLALHHLSARGQKLRFGLLPATSGLLGITDIPFRIPSAPRTLRDQLVTDAHPAVL
jgi:hypothetical protein